MRRTSPRAGVFVYADEKEREECVKALQSCLTLAKVLTPSPPP